MKKIVLIFIISILSLSCSTTTNRIEKSVEATNIDSKPLEIFDKNNFIDIDDTTVKFLFKVNKGDLVNFYIGETEKNLRLLEKEFLAGTRGLIVQDLKPNKKYFYQIEVIRNKDRVKTGILSFEKQGNTNNWDAPLWAKESIFYEVFVRSFYDGNGDGIGDFKGLESKIPYLKELGVDALWLMPINQSPSYHGYDVIDYYEVEKDYGTKEDFLSLLKAAHSNNIKIIIDLVINHSSTQHPWFQNSASNVNSEFRDYYIWADSTDNIKRNGPFGGRMWHKAGTGYYNGVFWEGMPDMNLRNKKVRDEFKKIASYWLDPNGDGDFSDGVDGFRLDAALHIDDFDKDVSHNWWQEFNTFVKSINKNALLVGENWASTNKMATFFEDLEASFNFSFATNILELASGKEVDLVEILSGIHSAYSKYSNNFIDATFITNHDQDRVSSMLGGDTNKIKFAASLLLTLPGTPFIYYGEELGQNGKKPDENIREPFDWYKDSIGNGMTTMNKGGFNTSMIYTKASDGISYQEQVGDDNSVLEHYKKLISIRKTHPEFYSLDNFILTKFADGIYSYKINGDNRSTDVLLNYTNKVISFQVDENCTELLTDVNYTLGETIEILPFTSLLLEKKY